MIRWSHQILQTQYCSILHITCMLQSNWTNERVSERASEKALIKPSTLIFFGFENWIPKISEQKSILLNFNIQQIPLNVSMVSLLILFGHFVAIVLSLSLFLFRSRSASVSLFLELGACCFSPFPDILSMLFPLAANTVEMCICNDPLRNSIRAFEWEFHYACSNKTNGKSTYGNQVTSKNDFIPTANCTRKSSFSRHIPSTVFCLCRPPHLSHFRLVRMYFVEVV